MVAQKSKPAYKRILLKLSGEALGGEQRFGFEKESCHKIASLIRDIHAMGVQIGIVIGGGNIFRGCQAEEFQFLRTPADHIGMLATTINGLILQQSLATLGCEAHVMSALNTDSIVERYSWQGAMYYLQTGGIVIFVGGTGNPYFTTDTAAALRASEINAEVLLKATKVDGIYDKDPKRHPHAKKFTKISYAQALEQNLNVMDGAAIALCWSNSIPIHVFDLFEDGALLKAVCEKKGGSLIEGS
ncbi:MAG: UMP kinase [Rhabdochlamydiaceae bacterium]|jgi:uridylate kinase